MIFINLFDALKISFYMFWDVLWPLVLGFTLAGIIQALVSHKKMAQLLGKTNIKTLTLASLFGIASSSCSYASVALARTIFRKGASFTNAMVFEMASTNLVIELGIILIVLLGWRFMAAQLIGGVIMVILIAIIFRFTLTNKLIKLAREHSEKGLLGKMEGHAAMDMSIQIEGTFWQKLLSSKGVQAVSEYFVMDITALWSDLLIGFLVAGALTVFVPQSFWHAFFLSSNPTLARIEGPLVGPLVAILSFVCSIGNIPLALVLWKSGISFGGVISFIFADLIVLPILDIYRKYYGWKVTAYILITFYLTMAAAGYIVEALFSVLNILPKNHNVGTLNFGISLNYTTYLNIVFVFIAIVLLWKFIKSGGLPMIKMMGNPMDEEMDCCKNKN